MIRILNGFLLSVFVMIVLLSAMCSTRNTMIRNDTAATGALEAVRSEGQPIIDLLYAYHGQKGFFPRNLSELANRTLPFNKFSYETDRFHRVYKSLECTQRQKSFEGWHPDPGYQGRVDHYINECVTGYSEFTLTSQPLPTSSVLNKGFQVFGAFGSQKPEWIIDWCSGGGSNEGGCDKGSK